MATQHQCLYRRRSMRVRLVMTQRQHLHRRQIVNQQQVPPAPKAVNLQRAGAQEHLCAKDARKETRHNRVAREQMGSFIVRCATAKSIRRRLAHNKKTGRKNAGIVNSTWSWWQGIVGRAGRRANVANARSSIWLKTQRIAPRVQTVESRYGAKLVHRMQSERNSSVMFASRKSTRRSAVTRKRGCAAGARYQVCSPLQGSHALQGSVALRLTFATPVIFTLLAESGHSVSNAGNMLDLCVLYASHI